MPHVFVRLYAELNDYLPPECRMKSFTLDVAHPGDVKTVLGLLHVPEDQVDLVLVNGESVDLSHTIVEGDRLSVYPVFETFDIASLGRIRARPLRETRFVLDTHLGKLASHLRMLGFDTLYRTDFQDGQLLEISNSEKRILLSRDRQLIASEQLSRGYRVHGTEPRLQLIEVVHRFDLFGSANPFTRCLRCNTPLLKVQKDDIVGQLPPKTKENFEEFETCPTCQRIYWKGSHYNRMREFVQRVLDLNSARDT